MTSTVTTSTADRRLLAEVSQWAHRNDWRDSSRGFQNAPFEDQATVAVRPNEAGFQVWRKPADAPHFTGQPTEYPAATVREAIDILVAIGALPARFSSASGVEAVIADREAQASSPEVAAAGPDVVAAMPLPTRWEARR